MWVALFCNFHCPCVVKLLDTVIGAYSVIPEGCQIPPNPHFIKRKKITSGCFLLFVKTPSDMIPQRNTVNHRLL